MRTAAIRPRDRHDAVQYAVLPWRIEDDALRILLITSRDTRRWVVPKGWPIAGLKPPDSAAREALEEAGVSGEVGREALGTFHYDKKIKPHVEVHCAVALYPLHVTRQKKRWAEKDQREGRWFAPAEAARLVEEPELRDLILAFGARKH